MDSDSIVPDARTAWLEGCAHVMRGLYVHDPPEAEEARCQTEWAAHP